MPLVRAEECTSPLIPNDTLQQRALTQFLGRGLLVASRQVQLVRDVRCGRNANIRLSYDHPYTSGVIKSFKRETPGLCWRQMSYQFFNISNTFTTDSGCQGSLGSTTRLTGPNLRSNGVDCREIRRRFAVLAASSSEPGTGPGSPCGQGTGHGCHPPNTRERGVAANCPIIRAALQCMCCWTSDVSPGKQPDGTGLSLQQCWWQTRTPD